MFLEPKMKPEKFFIAFISTEQDTLKQDVLDRNK